MQKKTHCSKLEVDLVPLTMAFAYYLYELVQKQVSMLLAWLNENLPNVESSRGNDPFASPRFLS